MCLNIIPIHIAIIHAYSITQYIQPFILIYKVIHQKPSIKPTKTKLAILQKIDHPDLKQSHWSSLGDKGDLNISYYINSSRYYQATHATTISKIGPKQKVQTK